jgi:hypothetical protein
VKNCPWCKNYAAATGDEDPNTLCRSHLAEYEGTSEDMLDREDADTYAESMGY